MRSRELDPSASPLDYYGRQLRRARETAGLTLAQLGESAPQPAATGKGERVQGANDLRHPAG